jgi:hypothetical protein
VPQDTATGDVAYFLEGGGSLGHVLRETSSTYEHDFIGVACVYGFNGTKKFWQGIELETVVLNS